MADRTYEILALQPSPEGPHDGVDRFQDLGVHPGHDAKAAIEAALDAHGLPEGAKVCIGVPASNWNVHDVVPDPRPQFKVTPRRTPSESGSSE